MPHTYTSAVLFSTILGLSTASSLPAQTQRSTLMLAPPSIGTTVPFVIQHPPIAAGNLYSMLLSMPPFTGSTTVFVPGFTIYGQLRVDPMTAVSVAAGLLDTSGQSPAWDLNLPANPAFVGLPFDVQGADLNLATNELYLADNDVTVVIGLGFAPPPGIDMVLIPRGSFLMGANSGPTNQRPQHQVTISRPFWMGKFELTQQQWSSLMGTNPSQNLGLNFPVERVSWNNAMAFCAALNAQETAAGRVPSGYVYRLPTEAEWEYACRAGTTTTWHFGATANCTNGNFSGCWGLTCAVGQYTPNAWGLHDMHGNVHEFCLDRYALHTSGPKTDPYVLIGTQSLLKGASWFDSPGHAIAPARYNWNFTGTQNNVGFRVVCGPIMQ